MTMPSISGPIRPRGPVRSAQPLRRSRADRVIGGVCGGLGRYFDVDPVLLRIAAVATVLASGLGVLAYVVAWIVIPDDIGEPASAMPQPSPGLLAWYLGIALIVLGGVLLLRLVVPWFVATVFWPLVIIVIGILVLVSATRGRKP